jgi:hypothetical protein
MDKLKSRLVQRGCRENRNLTRGGQRKRGWLGVKILEATVTIGTEKKPVDSVDGVPQIVSKKV